MERASSAVKTNAPDGSIASRTQDAPIPRRHAPVQDVSLLHHTTGNQAVQRLFRAGKLQAALKIGQSNDAFEQEADRVADQVMRTTENTVNRRQPAVSGPTTVIQTKPG